MMLLERSDCEFLCSIVKLLISGGFVEMVSACFYEMSFGQYCCDDKGYEWRDAWRDDDIALALLYICLLNALFLVLVRSKFKEWDT